jgi:PhnB protein
VVDPYGHQWSFATHIKDLSPEQMQAGMKEAFSQKH